MEKGHSNAALCVARDIEYSAGARSESFLDGIFQGEGLLATRSTLRVKDNAAENKEVISAKLAGETYSLIKSGGDSLPQMSIEKLDGSGSSSPFAKDNPNYQKVEGQLLQLDKMFKNLPKCEIDKD